MSGHNVLPNPEADILGRVHRRRCTKFGDLRHDGRHRQPGAASVPTQPGKVPVVSLVPDVMLGNNLKAPLLPDLRRAVLKQNFRGDIESRRGASSQLAASRLFSPPGALRLLRSYRRAVPSFGPALRPFLHRPTKTLDTLAILKEKAATTRISLATRKNTKQSQFLATNLQSIGCGVFLARQ